MRKKKNQFAVQIILDLVPDLVLKMSAGNDIDIDSIIERLLSVLSQRPGKMVNLENREIKALCVKSREIFISQPVLLELEAPIKICGTRLIGHKSRNEGKQDTAPNQRSTMDALRPTSGIPAISSEPIYIDNKINLQPI